MTAPIVWMMAGEYPDQQFTVDVLSVAWSVETVSTTWSAGNLED